MKPFRLTRQAEARLSEIAEWIVSNFGRSQALVYERQLIKRLNSLASGEPPHGRPCGILVSSECSNDDLLYYREGRHYIIFQDAPKQLTVIDFVHGSRNLPGVLEGLTGR